MYKFNNGNGAIVCNHCSIIISSPVNELPFRDFHLCDKCKPDWYNKLYMEDVHHICIEAMEGIKKGFATFGINIENPQYQKIEDDICNTISDKIEDYTRSEYRSHL